MTEKERRIVVKMGLRLQKALVDTQQAREKMVEELQSAETILESFIDEVQQLLLDQQRKKRAATLRKRNKSAA